MQANVWSVSAFGSSSLNLSRNSKTRPVPDHALPARAASEVMTPSGRSEPLPASLPATTTPVPVRAPRRAQEARQAPGSVRSRLRGMLGGHSAFETYLSELPASGVDRRKWLDLSHEQIEQAYQEAQQVRSEGRNFRTALLRALDVAVGAVIRPRAASGTGGAASAPPLNLASFAPAPKPAVDDAPRADGSSFRNSRWQAKKDAGRVVTVVQVDPNTNRVVLHDGVELNIVTLYLEYARVD